MLWAQAFLGDSYCNGEGVMQDYAEAVKWYRLDAAQRLKYQKNVNTGPRCGLD